MAKFSTLRREIGSGAYGSVIAISDSRVVKVFRAGFPGIFLRELLLMTYLQGHPGVVRLHSYNLDPCEFTMERWDYDLWRILTSNRGSPGERRVIFRDSLRALSYLHSLGLVHADVKSANIVVRISGGSVSAALIDYSLASLGPYADVGLTTVAYREPDSEPSWHHDVYSLGIVGLELFAGVTWIGRPLHTAVLKVCDRVLDPTLRRGLRGMLATERSQRLTASLALSTIYGETDVSPPALVPQLPRETAESLAIERCLALTGASPLTDVHRRATSVLAESLFRGWTRPLYTSLRTGVVVALEPHRVKCLMEVPPPESTGPPLTPADPPTTTTPTTTSGDSSPTGS